ADVPDEKGRDFALLIDVGELDSRGEQLTHGGIATEPGEDEDDCRQQRFGIEKFDDLCSAWGGQRPRSPGAFLACSIPSSAVGAAAVAHRPAPSASSPPRPAGVVADESRLLPGDLDQGGVDVAASARVWSCGRC